MTIMKNTTSKQIRKYPETSYLTDTAIPSSLSTALPSIPTKCPSFGSPSPTYEKVEDHGTKVQTTGDSFHEQAIEIVGLPHPRRPRSKITPWLLFVIIFASMTGLLMGYDLAVVSVVLKPIREHFDICGGESMCPAQEVFVAMIAPGALLGSIVGGTMADMWGRRWAMGLRDLAVILGTIVQATSQSYGMLLFGRTALGFGVGIGFVAFATYVSEVSPTDRRGQMVMIQECSQCAGVLLSSLIVVAAGRDGDDGAWRCDVDGAWRWLLGGPAIVAAINVLSHTFAWLYVSISPMSREP
eukprot:GHVS01070529.1.p1 GENE.GHVS01070529.1~~GHVS01070529.1.p1  ORF type:complete len:298 (-),score=39.48 GHVS01070529.1:337-1230(-)